MRRRFWRLRMFVRDYCSEFGIAWSLARMNDCERNGGHRWDESTYDVAMQAFGSTCSRCGSWQTAAVQPIISTTSGTGTSFQIAWKTSG